MKKIALVSVLAAAVAMPAFAADDMKAPAAAPAVAPVAAPATTAATPAPAAVTPAAGTTKIELMDGSWAQVAADGAVTVSKDGKIWTPAADGIWKSKDGKTTITTKDGKKTSM